MFLFWWLVLVIEFGLLTVISPCLSRFHLPTSNYSCLLHTMSKSIPPASHRLWFMVIQMNYFTTWCNPQIVIQLDANSVNPNFLTIPCNCAARIQWPALAIKTKTLQIISLFLNHPSPVLTADGSISCQVFTFNRFSCNIS